MGEPLLLVIGLESGAMVLLLVAFFALLGGWRGVQAEAVTLAGVLGTTLVLTSESMLNRLVTLVNKLPRVVAALLAPETTPAADLQPAPFIANEEQRLIFAVVIFAVAFLLFYLVGSRLSTPGKGMVQRLLGSILGGLTGFATTMALASFNQSYQRMHPEGGVTRLALPSVELPMFPATGSVSQVAPLVFMGAFFAFVVLVFAATRRAG